jgi:triosephosphate isomerase (TIM)
MRQPFIAGNWKMNNTVTEAQTLVKALIDDLNRLDKVETAVCPPFVSLNAVKDLIKGSKVKLGAQNLFYEEKGAFTGEVSALMLAGLCDYVIIGHSERRQYFQESSQVVSKKIAAALGQKIKPILCVGEVVKEYESGRTQEVVSGQVSESLAGITDIKDLVIAYEPVWAIGTGRAATGTAANQTIKMIRDLIGSKYSAADSAKLRILYGGSVTAANIAEFVRQPDIDGALVGGASLKAPEFINIVKQTAESKNG